MNEVDLEKLKVDKSDGYINNAYLRELIRKYNEMNYQDDGSWCAEYLSKLENSYNTNKIKKDKYDRCKKFILNKVKHINKLRKDYYSVWTPEAKRIYDSEFNIVKANLCEAFIKIIDGRVISFKLVASKDPEDINDIKQNALMTLFRYINRYDTDANSSAFAYTTQVVTNSIRMDLKEQKKIASREIAGLDFYNNINTLDDPMDGEGNIAYD